MTRRVTPDQIVDRRSRVQENDPQARDDGRNCPLNAASVFAEIVPANPKHNRDRFTHSEARP